MVIQYAFRVLDDKRNRNLIGKGQTSRYSVVSNI